MHVEHLVVLAVNKGTMQSGTGCSKLTTSLVNASFNFQT